MSAQRDQKHLAIAGVPHATVMHVTPEMAKQWLGYNSHNRKARDLYVNRYARDMTAGKWRLTGEAIKFDVAGTLLDGQHRLMAVVRSGCTVQFLVIQGLETEAQDHMDTGNARSASDMLGINGHQNTTALAAAARLALGVEAGDPQRHQPTHAEVRAFIEANPSLAESVAAIKPFARKSDCPPAMTAYTHWRMSQLDVSDATAFWSAAAEKIGLLPGDPVIALTNRFAEARRNREHLSRRIYLSLIFRAWNARRAGKSMRVIRVASPAGGLVPIPEPK